MAWLILPALLIALALKVAHDTREHDRVVRAERERFEDYLDRRAEH